MKRFFLIFFIVVPQWLIAQSQSTITIKTITIHNGDTVITERSYKSEGDHIYINDTLLNPKNYFLFFKKDYNLDTNFEESFNRIFGEEMREFLRNFNYRREKFFSDQFDFFNKDFSLNMDIDGELKIMDTLFHDNEYTYQIKPDNRTKRADTGENKPRYKYRLIETEPIITSLYEPVPGFGTDAFSDDGLLKIFFQLDEKKSTQMFLLDEKQKVLYKEKVPKSKGMYTRLFDFDVYPKGIYFLKVKQGKKVSVCKITKNRN